MKIPLSLFFCCSLLTLPLQALLVDFSAAEGYVDGDVKNQQGWSRVFGNEPLMSVDTGGSGSLVQSNSGGAIRRSFSDGEVGASFDANASIIAYEFVLEYNTISSSPTFGGIAWGIGDSIFNGTQLDLAVNFRDDGRIFIEDGVLSGNDRGLGGLAVVPTNTPLTVSLTVNWGTGTYSASRSDTGDTRTDVSFVKGVGGSGGHLLRIDSSQPLDASFDSFSIAAVPEPGTLSLLILSFLGLSLYRKSRVG